MSQVVPGLVLSTSPFVKRAAETPTVMRHVLYSLAPALAMAVYVFGGQVLLVLLASVLGALLAEWLAGGRGSLKTSTITDGSAVLTAVLLAMTLPPAIPLWMAFFGGAFGIIVGKSLFGGLGQNVFNPSLVARAFLQAAFPEAMTTWQAPREAGAAFIHVPGSMLALPFTRPVYDGVSAATPLARMKFESIPTDWLELFTGRISGSIGETSAILLLLGGAYLAYRRFLDWRIPVAVFGSVLVVATIMHAIDPVRYAGGVQHLFAGGLVLGALYMATDPVTSPVTPLGSWVFGIGVGLLVMSIRLFGGLPEAIICAVLLMNALVPHIDYFTQPRIYGGASTRRKEG